MASVKGTSIRGRLKYVQRYFGDAALDRVLSALRDQDRVQVLRAVGAVRSAWYPLELFVDLSLAVDRICGRGDGALLRAMSSQVAEDDLKTIHKLFIRFMAPSFILTKASQLWRQYYDSGRLEVRDARANSLILELVDFDAPSRVHCESVAGWCERSLKLSGAKTAQLLHDECRADGGKRCVFRGYWTM